MKKIIIIIFCIFGAMISVQAATVEKQVASVTMICKSKNFDEVEAQIVLYAWENGGIAACLPSDGLEKPCYLNSLSGYNAEILTPSSEHWTYGNIFANTTFAQAIATAAQNGNKYFYNYIARKAGINELTLYNIEEFDRNFRGKTIGYSRLNKNIIIDHSGYGTVTGTCSYTGYRIGTYTINESEIEPQPGKTPVYDTCDELSVDQIKACGCIPAGIADLTSKAYFILQIIGPVLLLILGGFEMAKAVSTQDESAIEKAKKKLVNKFIAAAAIFFVFTIMQFMVNLLAKNAEGIIECVDILLNGYVI